MTLRHRFEDLAIRGIRIFCRFAPRSGKLAMARGMGNAWFRLDRRRRERALRNLEAAFGEERSPHWRRRVARNSFRNLARAFCDTLELDRWDEARVDRWVEIEGWEHIERAYGAGRGVLLFSGHIGCWELVPHVQAMRGLPLNLVVRPLDNPRLDDLLTRLRTTTGNATIPKRRAVRTILHSLRRKEGVAIVIDQNLRSSERIFVDFFGRPAATTPTLALVARRTGALVVPVFCIPRDDGGYLIRYLPALEAPSGGDNEEEVRELTQTCTRIIEDMVRERPDAWLWMHRRWRTRPRPGELVEAPAVAGASSR